MAPKHCGLILRKTKIKWNCFDMRIQYTSADLTEHQIQACEMKRATGNPEKAQLEWLAALKAQTE